MFIKTLALSLIFGLASSLALSEPVPFATVQQCELEEQGILFDLVQSQYGEIPFLEGKTLVQTIQGTWLEAEFYMLMNPETRSFSVILVDPNSGTECLWLAGQNAAPSPVGDGI